jgi:peptide-methionine (R)-S-oxide reductase
MLERVIKNGAEWRRLLTPEQYRITREKGTERACSGSYHNFNGTGVYQCVCCGSRLFSSREKYAVPGKWPTFWAPIAPRNVKTCRDIFHYIIRNEVSCSRCDAHLGYVFEDGRPPSGVRYFINSAALSFQENCLRAKRPDASLHAHLSSSPAYVGAYSPG